MQKGIESRHSTDITSLSTGNRTSMAIIDIVKEKEEGMDMPAEEEKQSSSWESFFSSVCARLFFLLLIVFDALWFCYTVFKMGIYSVLQLGFLGSSNTLQARLVKSWISLKRSMICALSLFIALFSPAFGIMVGCTYFLMYDKKGIEEVVPASLRVQFKDLFAVGLPQE
jgi:hypothetical protein